MPFINTWSAVVLLMATYLPAVSGFAVATSSFAIGRSVASRTYGRNRTSLYVIRCEDKTYQLEELEDKDTCTSEVFLQADRTIYFGDTDGPIADEMVGRWDVEPGTNNFRMAIRRTFGAGRDTKDSTAMGEFRFDVEKLYEGEMTMVGESVAIQGAIKVNDPLNPDMEPMEVGYFNMIDGTDDRASYVERAEKLTS
mmetsp:Transcript_10695/g.22647  ORF Transcript_10695/g.22647 Transcript_10695/m.22647 type:complete len:196 (-) Transcript_10695:141-728(-)|eukprot:CAMPEP_0178482864 /NCGR_PEP_ID=MMETSP0696-20121128/6943_1 /TAXON_ID=265572 /ORGANISM="Extubocellulus spinifer, Strain CCMP396" /LENGTH=195 /DNA_ID=CAMNT_0020110373 /DNA_START=223 /DNA_END=810 /DNA_ORIENTATION=-